MSENRRCLKALAGGMHLEVPAGLKRAAKEAAEADGKSLTRWVEEAIGAKLLADEILHALYECEYQRGYEAGYRAGFAARQRGMGT